MESRWERKKRSLAKGAVVGTCYGVSMKNQGRKIGASLPEARRWSRGEKRELGGSESPSVTHPLESQTCLWVSHVCKKRKKRGQGMGRETTKDETEEEDNEKNP